MTWFGWEDLGGVATSDPAVASWAANRLDCFVRGTDNHMWHKWWNGSAWSGWEDLGGIADQRAGRGLLGPNRIDCFVRGTDNGDVAQVVERLDLERLGEPRWRAHVSARSRLVGRTAWTASSAAPTATCGTSGGTARAGAAGRTSAASSTGPRGRLLGPEPDRLLRPRDGQRDVAQVVERLELERLGEPGRRADAAPAAASWASNRIDTFVRGTDNHMWHKWWAPGWSGWEDLGGIIDGAPAAVSWARTGSTALRSG